MSGFERNSVNKIHERTKCLAIYCGLMCVEDRERIGEEKKQQWQQQRRIKSD